jgi:hypothetical protein
MNRFCLTVSALFLAAAALPARAAGDAVPAATAHYRVERPAGEKAAGVAISARVVFPAAARPVDEVSVAGIPVRIPSPLAPAAVGDAGCEVAAVFAEEPQANGTLELVYDGVAFDDFPRDGRTDWGLGTGCTGEVTARLEIVNPFPFTLPEGEWTVFQRPERGAPRLFPPVRAPALRARQRTTLHLGAVPNLSGERVRLAITEIVPGSVLEERFAVTVRNAGDEPRAVKVVEHFYRGGLPRLAEADAPHELAGPGEISFRLHVPPRGEKSVNYTVQYTW